MAILITHYCRVNIYKDEELVHTFLFEKTAKHGANSFYRNCLEDAQALSGIHNFTGYLLTMEMFKKDEKTS